MGYFFSQSFEDEFLSYPKVWLSFVELDLMDHIEWLKLKSSQFLFRVCQNWEIVKKLLVNHSVCLTRLSLEISHHNNIDLSLHHHC